MTTRTEPSAVQQQLQRQRRHEQRRRIDTETRHRNDAVLMHLGLAHHGANRLQHNGFGERDDLVQEARYGLIRALESFDPCRGHRISSYAMPRITGQIRHFRRDRLHTLRIPWRLGELHARGTKLQNSRLHAGLPPLGDQQLAEQLGVTNDRWKEACIAHRDRHLRSLHLPRRNSDGCTEDEAWIDRLPDPEKLGEDPQREWLIQALETLDPNHRRWLCAYWIDGLSLKEICQRESIERPVLRRSLKRSLNSLRHEADRVFSRTPPEARRQASPELLPRRSADH